MNQKVLLVDSDAKSQRVLEVSLKKAGFQVATARTVEDAQLAAIGTQPDVVVTEADFPVSSGFELCRRLRDDARTAGVAVVFLALDGSPEAKIRAISAGADEYLTKPTFVKEILTRVSGLLERRQKDAMSKKDRPANFRGTLGGMGLVDIFQLIESGRKNGVLHLRSDPARSGGLVASPTEAAIWFKDGRAVDAEAGALRGEAAVYRLLLWDDGDFELDFTPVTRDTSIHTSTQGLLLEGMRRVDEWARLAPQVPPLHARLEVDYRALTAALPSLPGEVELVVKLFDGRRKLLDALDDAPVDELSALGVVARLLEERVLVQAASGRASIPVSATTLEDWLANKRGPEGTGGGDPVDAADILANLPSELTAAMYPSMESASQILAAANIPVTEPPGPSPIHTVRPEPLADEPLPGTSAILSRSTIPASGVMPRPSLVGPASLPPTAAAPNEGRLTVRRLSSVVAPPPEGGARHSHTPPPPPPASGPIIPGTTFPVPIAPPSAAVSLAPSGPTPSASGPTPAAASAPAATPSAAAAPASAAAGLAASTPVTPASAPAPRSGIDPPAAPRPSAPSPAPAPAASASRSSVPASMPVVHPPRPSAAPPPPPETSASELPMLIRPASVPADADDAEATTSGAATSRPRRGNTRGAAFRAVRRPGGSARTSGAPGAPDIIDEVAEPAPAPAPAAATPTPVTAPKPHSPTPVPVAAPPPRAPAAVAAPVQHSSTRELDDDFAYLKQTDDEPRNNSIQVILALAVVGIVVGFIAWLTSDRKQQRVTAPPPAVAAVAPSQRTSDWPAEASGGMQITTLTKSGSVAGATTTATVVAAEVPIVPAVDTAAVNAEIDRGFAALKKERFKDAEKAYAKAIELDPDSAAAHAGLGHALSQLQRYKEATAAAKTALELSGDQLGHAHYVLGLIALDANDKAAGGHFKRFIALDPTSPFAAAVKPYAK